MTIELEPCPFCGGEAVLVKYLGGRMRGACNDDTCAGFDQPAFPEADAIAAWNRRAPASLPVQGVRARKLEWHGEGHSRAGIRANSLVGIYAIWTVEDGRVFLQKADEFKGIAIGGDLARAIEAAQSDYETRILGALEQ